LKLTKVKLVAKVKASLEKLGYIFFKESFSSAQGFFSKKLENGLYLSLGLQFIAIWRAILLDLSITLKQLDGQLFGMIFQ